MHSEEEERTLVRSIPDSITRPAHLAIAKKGEANLDFNFPRGIQSSRRATSVMETLTMGRPPSVRTRHHEECRTRHFEEWFTIQTVRQKKVPEAAGTHNV
jgi:hypothetical protein